MSTQPAGSPPPCGSAALDDVNAAFHDAYQHAEMDARRDAPVLVLFAETLVLHREDRAIRETVTPLAFHAIKSAVHSPVAAYALVRDARGAPRGRGSIEKISHLRDRTADALRDVKLEPREENLDVVTMLEETVAFLDRAKSGASSEADLEAFARMAGARIGPLMERSAEIQLKCLHDAVEKIVADLSPEERGHMQVVVAGHHQARDRSLGMQYFRKRLPERATDGPRVMYAEGAASVEDALAVVGKQRVDRDLARAFFGDASRMQRDLLGDAATRILESARLTPIESTGRSD